jgi:ferrous iron transport protein B
MNIATEQSPQLALARIALAGNPNCGKTTLFNALTGLRYKVANYPGVTVERKEGRMLLDDQTAAMVVDLPGIYSLSGHSLDERIATRAILGQLEQASMPDLVVAVVDASNLERNLFLTTQLIDLGIPVIIALNMIDIAEKQGISIKRELLSRTLKVPVVAITASKSEGLNELRSEIVRRLSDSHPSRPSSLCAWLPKDLQFELAALELGNMLIKYGHSSSIHNPIALGGLLLSDPATPADPELAAALQSWRDKLSAAEIDPMSFEATYRYQWINSIIRSCVSIDNPKQRRFSERVDGFITHKIWGTVTFLAIMTIIFQSIFLWATIPMELIDRSIAHLGGAVGSLLAEGALKSLIVDGIVAGVGSVLIFVPQIAILFFFLGILEDSGYLSRAAFLMDRIMRKFGLQGRSFIPLLSSFACAIPGILSTRTIPSFTDRMATILVAPLMSCSARLPVYTLLIAAFVPAHYFLGFVSLQGLVLLSMYLLGVVGAAVVSWILKKTLLRGEPAIFVMEMPPFRWPSFKIVLREVYDRIVTFLKSAGSVILAFSVVLWFLASYPQGKIEDTFAGKIGHAMEPVIKPLGFNWEVGVGLLASFAAREFFISSLSTVYNLEKDKGDEEHRSLIGVLKQREQEGTFSLAAALSLMVFYVFCCQCMSTLAVTRRETGSWGWTIFMFSYMTSMAYIAALITYQVGIRFLA